MPEWQFQGVCGCVYAYAWMCVCICMDVCMHMHGCVHVCVYLGLCGEDQTESRSFVFDLQFNHWIALCMHITQYM